MLFCNTKEWSTDKCYNLDGLRKHYAKWKRPVTKKHVLHNSIYIKYPK